MESVVLSKAELIVDERSILGESAIWDHDEDVLYWVDSIGKKVHIYNPYNRRNQTIVLDQFVGSLTPAVSGSLILASEYGLYELNMENEELIELANLKNHDLEDRFNDGKCDKNGRFWAGTMSFQNLPTSSLYCFSGKNLLEKKLDGVTISNGIIWSLDQRLMYYIDTPKRVVTAFQYSLDSGDISNPETVIYFPKGIGDPDGMTIDSEGMLWIAHWGGFRVSRWNPQNGKMLEEILLPVPNVTSCAFGGKDLNELFITTARGEKDIFDPNYPTAGGLYKVKTSVKGVVSNKFCNK